MVVVTIIGISLMAFTPSFIQSLADRRCATASMELVRIGRRARSESIGHQRAHVVFVNYGLGNPPIGRFQLLRGNSTHCDLENWAAPAALCGATGNNDCPENVNLSDTHWFHPPFAITVGMWNASDTPTPGVEAQVITRNRGSVALCYEPSGATRWSTSALGPGATMAFSGANAGAASGGGVMFSVGLVDAGSSTLLNTPRVVLYPLGTTPRRLR